MSQQLIIVRPPQLPPFTEVDGNTILVGYDPASDRVVRIKVSDLVGGEEVDLIWRSSETYSQDEIREYGLRLWKSLQDDNQGNIPSEGAFWTEVSRSGGAGITNWSPGVYTHNPSIVIFDGNIYMLNAVPFESVDFYAELAAGNWIPLTVNVHNNLLNRDALDAHPIGSITGLPAIIEALQRSIPSLNIRYLRSATTRPIPEITKRVTTEEPGDDPIANISVSTTGTTIETANLVGSWIGLPLENDIDFHAQNMQVSITANKNTTNRVVYILARIYNFKPDGSRELLGTSEANILTDVPTSYYLFLPVMPFSAQAGDRGNIDIITYQTGSGTAAQTNVAVEGNTKSRWTFDAQLTPSIGGVPGIADQFFAFDIDKDALSIEKLAVGDLIITGTVNHWLGDTITVDDANLQLNRRQGGATVSSGLIIYNKDTQTEVSKLEYDTAGVWRAGGQRIYTDAYRPLSDNSTALGGFAASLYPRKAEDASITGLWTINRSGENTTLLRFNTERAWRFIQTSTGATTGIALVSEVNSKDFDIRHASGNRTAVFRVLSEGATVYLTPDGGSVGICVPRTSSPSERLHVVGNALITGTINGVTPTDWARKSRNETITGWWNFRGNSPRLYITDTTQNTQVGFENSSNALLLSRYGFGTNTWQATLLRISVNAPNNSFILEDNGFVGIGTATPTERLHVAGNGLFEGSGTFGGNVKSSNINTAVQSLSGTSPTFNLNNGHNAKIILSGNTTISVSNLIEGTTGNITVTNPSTAHTVSFSGATVRTSPSLSASGGTITMSGGSKVDVLSWYYDGTYFIINGTLGYE